MILISIAIIFLVSMQQSPSGGMSALTGGDSYYNKNQGRTLDAMLSKGTKYSAIAMFIVTILAYAANVYLK